MAKAHEAKLAEQKRPDTEDAAKIVKLVNEAIHKTRELARGLLVLIQLTAEQGRGTLLITDDGKGVADNPANTEGMGLHIMNYRAGMIGGVLEVRPGSTRGTVVTCTFPVENSD
jgi:nitrate/nitrite-specific signal transduction histidine kinase